MSVWKLVLVSRPVLGLNLTYHQHQPQSPLKRGQRSLHLIWIFLLKFMFMNGKILVMASKLLKRFLTTLHPGKRPLASIADLEGGPTLPVSPCKCRRELQPCWEAVKPLDSTFLWNFSDPGILWLCLGQGAVEIQLNSNWRLHCVDWLALKFYGLFVIFAGMSLSLMLLRHSRAVWAQRWVHIVQKRGVTLIAVWKDGGGHMLDRQP